MREKLREKTQAKKFERYPSRAIQKPNFDKELLKGISQKFTVSHALVPDQTRKNRSFGFRMVFLACEQAMIMSLSKEGFANLIMKNFQIIAKK